MIWKTNVLGLIKSQNNLYECPGLIYDDQNFTGREGRIIFLASSTFKLSSARTIFAMSLIHSPPFFFLLEPLCSPFIQM